MKEKKFKTVKELVTDDIFRSELSGIILKIKGDRYVRPLPKPGYHYKRDGIDEMLLQKNLNVDYFSNNIGAIWSKQSQLSSRQRTIISTICNEAVYKTLIKYGEIERKENETIKSKTT